MSKWEGCMYGIFKSPFLFGLTLSSNILPFTLSSCLGSLGLLALVDVSIDSNENELRFTRLQNF